MSCDETENRKEVRLVSLSISFPTLREEDNSLIRSSWGEIKKKKREREFIQVVCISISIRKESFRVYMVAT